MLAAMVQENERALGGWQSEWECLPQIVQLTAGALRHMLQAVGGLQVNVQKMHSNLGLTHGQILAEAVTLALSRTMAARRRTNWSSARAEKPTPKTGICARYWNRIRMSRPS